MCAAFKRINTDIKALEEQDLDYVTINPTDSSLIWEIIIMGPPGSPYEDGNFTFTIEFPKNYPFTAPQIILKTKIYHPLVNHDTNEFCAAHITNDWKSTLTLSYIVKELYAMLDHPEDFEAAHDTEVANLCKNDYDEFFKRAQQWTEEYAQ